MEQLLLLPPLLPPLQTHQLLQLPLLLKPPPLQHRLLQMEQRHRHPRPMGQHLLLHQRVKPHRHPLQMVPHHPRQTAVHHPQRTEQLLHLLPMAPLPHHKVMEQHQPHKPTERHPQQKVHHPQMEPQGLRLHQLTELHPQQKVPQPHPPLTAQRQRKELQLPHLPKEQLLPKERPQRHPRQTVRRQHLQRHQLKELRRIQLHPHRLRVLPQRRLHHPQKQRYHPQRRQHPRKHLQRRNCGMMREKPTTNKRREKLRKNGLLHPHLMTSQAHIALNT